MDVLEDDQAIDINDFGRWTLEKHGIRLNLSDARAVEAMLQGGIAKASRQARKQMLSDLLREYRDETRRR